VRRALSPIALLSAIGLLACAAGDADHDRAPASGAEREPPAGSKRASAAASTARAGECRAQPRPEDAALAQALVERVNRVRGAGADCGRTGRFGPSAPLLLSAQLRCMAEMQSADMAERGFFSHVNPDGHGVEQRASALGLRHGVGENLAWGQTTPEGVVAAWLRSPDHCKTMLRPDYTVTGAAYRRSAAGRTLWVQVLALR
jgi:uncharacterized protein YkwD